MDNGGVLDVLDDANCWAFRVDRRFLTELFDELKCHNRLRQGWGWDSRQDLRCMSFDGGASRNRRMRTVKKGDLVLIPHLPAYGRITIAQATEDWEQGYEFNIWGETGDHGHIFPARYICDFHRQAKTVPGDIRGTFRNPCRFWSISRLRPDIIKLALSPEEGGGSRSSAVARWKAAIVRAVDTDDLSRKIVDSTHRFTTKSEWEEVLAEALRMIHPEWEIETTSNRLENKHGTDILIRIPKAGGYGCGSYGIAIQVKDWSNEISTSAVDQIRKALTGYGEEAELKIIDLILAVTDADSPDDASLEMYAAGKSDSNGSPLPPVQIWWRPEVDSIVTRASLLSLAETFEIDG